MRAAIAWEKHRAPTTGGSEPFVPWWTPIADYAEVWGVPPWAIVERQATDGDALDWIRRAQTLARARRDAG